MKYITNNFIFFCRLLLIYSTILISSCSLFHSNKHIGSLYSRDEKNKFENFIFKDSSIFNYYYKPFENNELLLFSKGFYQKISKNKYIIKYESYEIVDALFEENYDKNLSEDSLHISFSQNLINEFFHEVCIEINDSIYEVIQINKLDLKIKKPKEVKKIRVFYTTTFAYSTQTQKTKDFKVNVLKVNFTLPKTKLYTRVFGFQCDKCIFNLKESETYSINLFKNNCQIIDTLYLNCLNRLNYSNVKWNLKKKLHTPRIP